MTRVLILEPCPRTCRSIARVLTDSGMECVIVLTSGDALERLARGEADLLIMDVDLFRTETNLCLEELRQRGLEIPVLLLSGGHPRDSERDACAMACRWADALLIKPFESDDLLSTVRSILSTAPGSAHLQVTA